MSKFRDAVDDKVIAVADTLSDFFTTVYTNAIDRQRARTAGLCVHQIRELDRLARVARSLKFELDDAELKRLREKHTH